MLYFVLKARMNMKFPDTWLGKFISKSFSLSKSFKGEAFPELGEASALTPYGQRKLTFAAAAITTPTMATPPPYAPVRALFQPQAPAMSTPVSTIAGAPSLTSATPASSTTAMSRDQLQSTVQQVLLSMHGAVVVLHQRQQWIGSGSASDSVEHHRRWAHRFFNHHHK